MSKKKRIQAARRAERARATKSDHSRPPMPLARRLLEHHFGKLIAATLLVGIAINAVVWLLPENNNSVMSLVPSEEVLALGERRYAEVCASCHGRRGQGYANPALPAPALNGSEHAWHHSDAQIRGWMRDGYMNMPAVPGSWRDEDIDAVLTYIKQWWTPEQQAFQASR